MKLSVRKVYVYQWQPERAEQPIIDTGHGLARNCSPLFARSLACSDRWECMRSGETISFSNWHVRRQEQARFRLRMSWDELTELTDQRDKRARNEERKAKSSPVQWMDSERSWKKKRILRIEGIRKRWIRQQITSRLSVRASGWRFAEIFKKIKLKNWKKTKIPMFLPWTEWKIVKESV